MFSWKRVSLRTVVVGLALGLVGGCMVMPPRTVPITVVDGLMYNPEREDVMMTYGFDRSAIPGGESWWDVEVLTAVEEQTIRLRATARMLMGPRGVPQMPPSLRVTGVKPNRVYSVIDEATGKTLADLPTDRASAWPPAMP